MQQVKEIKGYRLLVRMSLTSLSTVFSQSTFPFEFRPLQHHVLVLLLDPREQAQQEMKDESRGGSGASR